MQTHIHTPDAMSVPLSSLFLSPFNVRKVSPSAVETMAASLSSPAGQLQNLVVYPEQDRFGVVAGGCRLRAFQLLAERGQIDADHPVQVALRDVDDATLVSLAENVVREDMHPADEYEAFAKLLAQGWSIDRIADAFKVTPLVVERRLTLAKAAPELIALYREDQITTEQMIALCSTDDHERQRTVWDTAPAYARDPSHLRRMLTQGEIDAKRDPRVRFIGGVDAYREAGGGFRVDLFSADGAGGFLTDAALLETLVAAKLEQAAEQVRTEGWSWVEVQPQIDHDAFYRFGRVHGEVVMNEAATAALAALEAERTRLDAEYEALQEIDGELDEAQSARLDEIEERWHEMGNEENRIGRDLPVRFDPAVLTHAGALVTMTSSGELRIERGLVRASERKALARATATSVEGGRETERAGRKQGELPDALRRSLLARRNHAAQMATAQNPRIAKVLLAMRCLQLIGGDGYRCSEDVPCDLAVQDFHTGTRTHNPVVGEDAETLRGQLAEALRAVTGALPKKQAEVWDALMGKTDEELDAIIAFGVAASISLAADHGGLTGKLLDALAFDVSHHVVMTADNYFGRVSKAMILDGLKEAGLDHDRAALEAMKKGALAEEAERRIRTVGSGWVPKLIRTPAPKAGKPAKAKSAKASKHKG